jgi:hypothetical protein
MNPQRTFDRVAKHLLKQGCKSHHPMKGCLYRGPRKTMCAIGCLITDREYDKKMENKCVSSLLKYFPKLHRFAKVESLLDYLQSVHDKNEPENWKEELRGVARRFNLSSAVIK